MIFGKCKPLIGVVHLPPLPGSPGYRRSRFPDARGDTFSFNSILEYGLSQAKAYEAAGFDGVIVENYGDKPLGRVANRAQVASMAVVTRAIAEKVSIPVGVNVLRNSGAEAIVVAHLSGAKFIRINNLCEVRVSPEGILYPEARRMARALSDLGLYEDLYAERLIIMSDVNVKHSYALSPADPASVMRDCVERSGFPIHYAVVSGPRTGEEPGYDAVEAVLPVAKELGLHVIVGSGVTGSNLSKYWRVADGFIVGTSVKIGGRPEAPVSEERAASLAKLAEHFRSSVGCT